VRHGLVDRLQIKWLNSYSRSEPTPGATEGSYLVKEIHTDALLTPSSHAHWVPERQRMLSLRMAPLAVRETTGAGFFPREMADVVNLWPSSSLTHWAFASYASRHLHVRTMDSHTIHGSLG
jgi:hypothetical protein